MLNYDGDIRRKECNLDAPQGSSEKRSNLVHLWDDQMEVKPFHSDAWAWVYLSHRLLHIGITTRGPI